MFLIALTVGPRGLTGGHEAGRGLGHDDDC